jgi:STE24 endopeptidase
VLALIRNLRNASLKTLLLFFSAIIALTTVAHAQSSPTASEPPHAQTSHQPEELKVTEYVLPPDKLAKAKALYEISTVLYLFGMVFEILVLWVLLKLRVVPVFRNLAERNAKNGFLQSAIFVPLLMLLIAAISMPLEIYGHHISRAYGLSVQGWGSWLADWCKGQAIFVVFTTLASFGLFRIIHKSNQRWWFYFWLLTLPFVVLLIFVAPVIIDPMFNTFVPLEKTQPQLLNAIETVAERGGLNIPSNRMFEMKASEKVTTYNAYVTGIGATKRVVVWDNTARDMTIPETLFVFGHEMGHYVLNHIYKGLAFFAALSFIGFWLGRKIVLAMLARWGDHWRIRGISDLAALPVFLLALALLTIVSEPIANAFSRHLEHQADIYGLEVTHALFPHNREVAALTFQMLGEKSYDYPNPNFLLVLWFYDHPTIQQRITFALQYDPWKTPAGPKYVK